MQVHCRGGTAPYTPYVVVVHAADQVSGQGHRVPVHARHAWCVAHAHAYAASYVRIIAPVSGMHSLKVLVKSNSKTDRGPKQQLAKHDLSADSNSRTSLDGTKRPTDGWMMGRLISSIAWETVVLPASAVMIFLPRPFLWSICARACVDWLCARACTEPINVSNT